MDSWLELMRLVCILNNNDMWRSSVFLSIILFLIPNLYNCKPIGSKYKHIESKSINDKIVLAQWSFNKELFAGEMNTFDFVKVAKEMDFGGVEYVNQFFMEKVEDTTFLDSLKTLAEENKIKNTLLMIDGAGNLGASNQEERSLAVSEHKRWMLTAKRMGCPNIRVNAHGDGTSDEVLAACKTSISELGRWGKQHGVGILIENHGGYSSDGGWLLQLVEGLAAEEISSLADFDNWCMERENGKLWGAPCIKEYNRYLGMEKLLPFAKSVSVKAFDFDKDGMPIKTDFEKMFELIHKAGYSGYLAVEFEGHKIDAKTGIRKIKMLIDKFGK